MSLDILNEAELRKFKEAYEIVKQEIIQDPAFEHDEVSRQWLDQMIDYNIHGGSKHRRIVEIFKFLSENPPSEEELFQVCVLGWCLQWIFSGILVLDDIVDNSHTRGGKPCWFRLPKVGLRAANGGVLLISQSLRVIRKHFKDHPYYTNLLELTHEIIHQATYGQMIDLITPIAPIDGNEEDILSNYNPKFYRRICLFKTAYGGHYSSFVFAMIILGKQLDEFVAERNILLDIGVFFQEKDDYLDCYSDHDKFGKIGTDIEESKCSWMVVKALLLCNEEQKKILCENYTKGNPESIVKVKSLYKDLNLKGVFAQHEVYTHDKLLARIEALPSKPMQAILKKLLNITFKKQS